MMLLPFSASFLDFLVTFTEYFVGILVYSVITEAKHFTVDLATSVTEGKTAKEKL